MKDIEDKLAAFLMEYGVLKNADADKMARKIAGMFEKEREDLRIRLSDAYRAACHYMVCRECAESEPCIDGEMHREKLVECEPLIVDWKGIK